MTDDFEARSNKGSAAFSGTRLLPHRTIVVVESAVPLSAGTQRTGLRIGSQIVDSFSYTLQCGGDELLLTNELFKDVADFVESCFHCGEPRDRLLMKTTKFIVLGLLRRGHIVRETNRVRELAWVHGLLSGLQKIAEPAGAR